MTKQGTFGDRLRTRGRKALAQLARVRYRQPQNQLKIIAVTGSKGKTTTTDLIYRILRHAGLKAGCISTIGAYFGDEYINTGLHTTSPEPWDLPKYLRKMVDAGVQYVVLEATSMGLQQGRFDGIEFDISVITNIASDHLDYHITWENYAESKFQVVEMLKPKGLVVVNADHASADWLAKRAEKMDQEVLAAWFGKSELVNLKQSLAGSTFMVDEQEFSVNFFGDHLLENVLAAIKVCQRYIPLNQIAEALTNYKLPAGRMELLQSSPFHVIVDFAHTPDSLERSLASLIEYKEDSARSITVFGCAGERDPDRRRMGQIAAKYSRIVLLTAEDPRSEYLGTINDQIFATTTGMNAVQLERYADHEEFSLDDKGKLASKIDRVLLNGDVPFIMFDEMTIQSRYDAINLALRIAQPNDIVFVTGKGHEQSLCFGKTEFPWSDQETIKSLLKSQ